MRVISGSARGRKLREPKGMDIRPTADHVKEAVFDIIQFRIPGASVLDLFTGTGQLGIEALSRGAARVVMVDQSQEAVKLARENLRICAFEQRAELVCAESVSFLRRGERFDVIFLDPPYDGDLLDRAIESILRFDILKDNGIMVCESRVEKSLPPLSGPYFFKKEYRYGRIKLTTIVRRQEEEQT